MNYLKMNHPDSDTILISFAGHDKGFGGIPQLQFVRFFETKFHHISRHFYLDPHSNLYHQGMSQLSNSIDETVAYLKNEIKPYKKVICMGVSAGGYAAILFGSLLSATTVLAFIPQTIRRSNKINETYRDLQPHLNDTTHYILYADTSIIHVQDVHHVSHCERIADRPNVDVIKIPHFNLKTIRDNGELFNILQNIIEESVPIP